MLIRAFQGFSLNRQTIAGVFREWLSFKSHLFMSKMDPNMKCYTTFVTPNYKSELGVDLKQHHAAPVWHLNI